MGWFFVLNFVENFNKSTGGGDVDDFMLLTFLGYVGDF